MEQALLQTILSLVAVLGLMIGILLLVKKYVQNGPGNRSSLVQVDVLGQRVLQPKRMLYIVKVLNKVMVLSSTEEGIRAIGEIDDPATIQSIELKQEYVREHKSASGLSFRQRLRAAETLGDFFHKPFNVILWRGDKPEMESALKTNEGSLR